jgi:hypothetical protein
MYFTHKPCQLPQATGAATKQLWGLSWESWEHIHRMIKNFVGMHIPHMHLSVRPAWSLSRITEQFSNILQLGVSKQGCTKNGEGSCLQFDRQQPLVPNSPPGGKDLGRRSPS